MATGPLDSPEPHRDDSVDEGGDERESRMPNLDSSAEERDWSNLGDTNIVDVPSKSTPSLGSPIPLEQAMPGMVLGDYRLLEKLGEGAMGVVYRAEQVSFDRIVALKLLFPRIARQPNLVERLYREGRVLGQLDHPNIVQAYAIDELNGSHCVAMEYVEGDNLQRWIRKLSRLSVEDAVHIAIKIAGALEYAHAQGIVHRDLKPENVLITKKGQVKIADFGMVKVTDEEMDLTQTGHALGTPWYMPLEQAKNAKDIDGRSDIYALGCLTYCLLTGAPPFAGRTFAEVLLAKELGTFPPARSVNEHVPEKLDLIVFKMAQKQAKHRYATGGEIVRDLESLGLASPRLSFLTQTPKTGLGKDAKDGKEAKPPAAQKTLTESPTPSFDPHVWFLKMSGGIGKFSTEQVLAMIDSQKVNVTTMASHLARSDYRALSTYKEFAGPLAKATRQAEKTPSRYEEIYKQAEQRDKAREESFASHMDRGQWTQVALYYGQYVAAAVVILLVLYWFASRFF
jgi:serine/threonine-protein kinase